MEVPFCFSLVNSKSFLEFVQNSKNTSRQSVSKIVQSVSIEVKTILHFEYSCRKTNTTTPKVNRLMRLIHSTANEEMYPSLKIQMALTFPSLSLTGVFNLLCRL